MDKEERDLLHKYFLMGDMDLEGMTLQELFDHRFEYLELRKTILTKYKHHYDQFEDRSVGE